MKIIQQYLEEEIRNSIPKRKLGRTNARVPILGMGGGGILDDMNKEGISEEIIGTAFDLGIRYFDTAYSYGKAGVSEKNIGRALGLVRDEVYINTKTTQRTYDGADRELDMSLKRLKTDHVDCLQIHSVEDMPDVEKIFSKDGPIKLLEKAKEDGRIKYCGLTSHKNPYTLLEAARRYDFDTVLCVVNCADIHYLSFIKTVLPYFRDTGTGIIAMKVMSAGRIPKRIAAKRALHYSLSVPGVACAIIGTDSMSELKQNVKLAKQFIPLTLSQKRACEKVTKKNWKYFNFFKEGFEWPKQI